jgi:hypothetical protein
MAMDEFRKVNIGVLKKLFVTGLNLLPQVQAFKEGKPSSNLPNWRRQYKRSQQRG